MPAVPAAAHDVEGDQIVISPDYSNDAITYTTSSSAVTVRRSETNDIARYLLTYTANGGPVRSFEFDATPSVDTFDIVLLEQSDTLCGRKIAVVTLREYTLVEGPKYLYTKFFVELTHPSAASDYLDEHASQIGGPTPIGLIETYADVDCSVVPVMVSSRK